MVRDFEIWKFNVKKLKLKIFDKLNLKLFFTNITNSTNLVISCISHLTLLSDLWRNVSDFQVILSAKTHLNCARNFETFRLILAPKYTTE